MKHPIISVFENERNAEIAKQQSAYMKNRFEYFGLKTPFRRDLQKPFLLKENLPTKAEAFDFVQQLWNEPQRELHYFAQELLAKYMKKLAKEDLKLIEWLIVRNSWWDTIDFIATKSLAYYFKQYPEEINPAVDRWLKSENIWLQRSALLFQLKYKKDTDLELLEEIILKLNHSKEFFIKKAIGWVLRENSRMNEKWVIDFVAKHELQPLSKKEALRLITS
ncbi:DNA alkylation repair protein [Brumimicrobium aurantiacum]|uniref:DNA alkylation repair protein n=1 Tax=Brumimicrobium aurantiacum TaxID=1737063 RepID=A0A3E1EX77_9FLAO|nr:DNA alkylation repair protein [Brumimicrobium aurantiacum]RFC54132.1 DNA alkylation repair protein [Brumimicrobium aurantiacum]